MGLRRFWPIMSLPLLLLLVIGLAACGDDDDGGGDNGGANSGEAEVVKVGFTGSLTGPAAEYGSGIADGMTMAFEDAGVVELDDGSYRFEVTALDDGYDPSTGSNNARRLVEESGIHIATTQGGTISVATEPIFSEAGIIQFHYGGATAYMGPDKPLAFRTAFTYGDAFPIVWPWLAENYSDIQTVALIHPDDETGHSQAAVEQEAVAAVGLEITTTEYVARDVTDFYPVLTGVLNDEPDAVSFAMPPGQQSVLIQQLKELGYEGYILSGALSELVLADLGSTAEGVLDPVCVAMPFTDEASSIQDRWEDERGSTPSISLLDGYLIGWLIVETAKGAGTIDSQAMAEALHTIDLSDTIFGRMAWHEVNGVNNAMVHDVAVCEVTDGQLELVGVAEVPS